jgi:hypothetical protein
MSIPSFSLASLKSAADELRAQVYPRNETERRVSFGFGFVVGIGLGRLGSNVECCCGQVYEALSSKNWGASSTLMQDIAQDTMD